MEWWGQYKPQREWLFHNKQLMHFKLLNTWAWNKSILLLVNATAVALARRLTAWRDIHKVTQHVNAFFFLIGIITSKKLAISSWVCIWLHSTMRTETLLSLWILILIISACTSTYCECIKHWVLYGLEILSCPLSHYSIIYIFLFLLPFIHHVWPLSHADSCIGRVNIWLLFGLCTNMVFNRLIGQIEYKLFKNTWSISLLSLCIIINYTLVHTIYLKYIGPRLFIPTFYPNYRPSLTPHTLCI